MAGERVGPQSGVGVDEVLGEAVGRVFPNGILASPGGIGEIGAGAHGVSEDGGGPVSVVLPIKPSDDVLDATQRLCGPVRPQIQNRPAQQNPTEVQIPGVGYRFDGRPSGGRRDEVAGQHVQVGSGHVVKAATGDGGGLGCGSNDGSGVGGAAELGNRVEQDEE